MTEQTTPDSATEVVAPAVPETATVETPDMAAVVLKPSLMQLMGALLAHPKAPLYFIIAVAIGIVGFVGYKVAPRFMGTPQIVLFDPVRFVNAQRAAASILATRPNADLTLTMTQVAKQAEEVIHAKAGGAVVLIRQAVVVPDGLRDITDDVLKHFGLPTNVPTVNNSAETMSLENLAPTNSSFSAGAINEEYRMELESRARDAAIEQNKKSTQQSLIP